MKAVSHPWDFNLNFQLAWSFQFSHFNVKTEKASHHLKSLIGHPQDWKISVLVLILPAKTITRRGCEFPDELPWSWLWPVWKKKWLGYFWWLHWNYYLFSILNILEEMLIFRLFCGVFFMSETSEKIYNSTFRVKISV